MRPMTICLLLSGFSFLNIAPAAADIFDFSQGALLPLKKNTQQNCGRYYYDFLSEACVINNQQQFQSIKTEDDCRQIAQETCAP